MAAQTIEWTHVMQDWIVDLKERSMQPVLANPSKQVMRLLNNSNITPLLGASNSHATPACSSLLNHISPVNGPWLSLHGQPCWSVWHLSDVLLAGQGREMSVHVRMQAGLAPLPIVQLSLFELLLNLRHGGTRTRTRERQRDTFTMSMQPFASAACLFPGHTDLHPHVFLTISH